MGMFSEALQIRKGVTAVMGGGGKTGLLYRLAGELPGSVILCTTTHIFPPPHLPVVQRTEAVQGVICVGTPCETGKLTAPRQPISELAALADYVLVEADGSKHLPLKAHLPHEPVIPPEAEQVICVVGASGLNRPVALAAHRPERFALLAGSELADPPAVARVLEREALHHRVFINQADSPERIAAALALAKLLRCPVVVASLQKGEILCSY